MPLLKLPIVSDYDSLQVNRTIYSDYKCNCTKYWDKEDKFIIYKANKDGIEKVFNSNIEDVMENIDVVVDIIGPDISNKPIVSGGHTVVNLKDRFHISDEVLRSVEDRRAHV